MCYNLGMKKKTKTIGGVIGILVLAILIWFGVPTDRADDIATSVQHNTDALVTCVNENKDNLTDCVGVAGATLEDVRDVYTEINK